MTGTQILVLNGGSSSGKSTLAHCLQQVLDGYWLRLGVDTLIDAAPATLLSPAGLNLAADGSVGVGPDFTEIEGQWMIGIAAMAGAGARVIVEDNFVSGPTAQQRWRAALTDLTVGWIGVRCAADIAARREAGRPDRIIGMAAAQAEAVHRGISYDLEVDTGHAEPLALAQVIRDHFEGRSGNQCSRPPARHEAY